MPNSAKGGFPRSAVVSVRAKTGLWAKQPENAVCGEDDNAEHQVTERLEMATDAEEAPAEFVFQASAGRSALVRSL